MIALLLQGRKLSLARVRDVPKVTVLIKEEPGILTLHSMIPQCLGKGAILPHSTGPLPERDLLRGIRSSWGTQDPPRKSGCDPAKMSASPCLLPPRKKRYCTSPPREEEG